MPVTLDMKSDLPSEMYVSSAPTIDTGISGALERSAIFTKPPRPKRANL